MLAHNDYGPCFEVDRLERRKIKMLSNTSCFIYCS